MKIILIFKINISGIIQQKKTITQYHIIHIKMANLHDIGPDNHNWELIAEIDKLITNLVLLTLLLVIRIIMKSL